jgi:hypothetical protein
MWHPETMKFLMCADLKLRHLMEKHTHMTTLRPNTPGACSPIVTLLLLIINYYYSNIDDDDDDNNNNSLQLTCSY